eukprot:COSAG02_NODE_5141_length_4595_cov_1.739991_4_plen_75_part_00
MATTAKRPIEMVAFVPRGAATGARHGFRPSMLSIQGKKLSASRHTHDLFINLQSINLHWSVTDEQSERSSPTLL